MNGMILLKIMYYNHKIYKLLNIKIELCTPQNWHVLKTFHRMATFHR